MVHLKVTQVHTDTRNAVTRDVTFSTGANVAVIVHVLEQSGVSITGNDPLRFGTDVRFPCKSNYLSQHIVLYHDRIAFDGDFEFVEIIT